MPAMTGLVLAARLRAIRVSLPVIIMTGYTAPQLQERVKAAGVRELLVKPVTIRSLGIAVHAALSGAPNERKGTKPPFVLAGGPPPSEPARPLSGVGDSISSSRPGRAG